ncbi:fibroblast growth factor receptor 1-like [Acropora muricata]|uniref:fibroblast growth factor receptor 1-like n=1 Tax=Acropora muricata TaxID=159855 RepID=UPI0034E59078
MQSFPVILIFGACLFKGADAKGIFVLTPADPFEAQEGSNVTLHWDYTGSNLVSLAWGVADGDNNLSTIIARKQGNNDVQYSSSYRDRVLIEGRASLVVYNVKASDSKRYGCQLTFQGQSSPIFSSVRLLVNELTTTTQGLTVGESRGESNNAVHPLYFALVAVLFLLIVLVIAYYCMTRRTRAVVFEKRNSQLYGPDDVAVEMDVIPRDDMDVPLNRTEPPDRTFQDYCVISPVPSYPNERDWEIPRENLVSLKVIGKGAFGQVARGTLLGGPNKDSRLVAIKMLRDNATDENRQDFLVELNTMKKLDSHPNVVQLLGCVTKSEPIMGITEYAPFGDLLGYLRKSRGLRDSYYNDPDIKPRSSLSSKQLLGFSRDIASGMEFLSLKKIIHRDLAARNVLVGESEVCKITDFGLARDVFKNDLYTRNAAGRLPVKWTAFESLLHGICTTMSDVWSYGIVMYEIFTIGGAPYPKVDTKAIASLLEEGYRMPKPPHLADKLYDVMKACWHKTPEMRPSFTDLRNTMRGMCEEEKMYINLNGYDTKLYQSIDEVET